MDKQNFSFNRDIPYFVKQHKNQFTTYSAQRVEQYFRNKKNQNIFIMDDQDYKIKPNELLDNENNNIETIYYLVNHIHVLPLKIVIEKLKQGDLSEIQKNVIEILIWSIVQEYKLILYDHQLFHNNIIIENILIILKAQKFYFLNNFSSIDVRFINFDLSEEFQKQSDKEKQDKDIQSLKKIIEELCQLIQKNVPDIQDLASLIKFSQSIKYQRSSKDKKQPIFKIQWNEKQIEELNNLLQEQKNNIKLSHSVLKAIFLQHYYLNPKIDQNDFVTFISQYKYLYEKIESHQNLYQNQIKNFQNSLNQYIIKQYKLDHNFDIDNKLIEDFDKNLFEKIVDLANFKQGAINEIEEIVDDEYRKAIEKTKMLITNHIQQELNEFILSLYCDLV